MRSSVAPCGSCVSWRASEPGQSNWKGDEMEQHVTILGVLHIAWGALGIIAALVIFIAVVGGGAISGDPEAMAVTSLVGTIVSLSIALPCIPGLLGGFGIFGYRQWARIALLVAGFINLVFIPFGTIVGIYTIWVLMHGDVKRMFEERAAREAAGGELR